MNSKFRFVRKREFVNKKLHCKTDLPAPDFSLFYVCSAESTPEHQSDLFDTGRMHTVDVQISETNQQDLPAHPEDKVKYETDVVIDGEPIEQVALSAKGNSSPAFGAYSTDGAAIHINAPALLSNCVIFYFFTLKLDFSPTILLNTFSSGPSPLSFSSAM